MGGTVGHRLVDAALLAGAVVVAITLAGGASPATGAAMRPAVVADQLTACGGDGSLVPSYCVSLPRAAAAMAQPDAADARRHGCADLREDGTPLFCLALPSADQGDAEIERTTALAGMRARLGSAFRSDQGGAVDAWVEDGIGERDSARLRAGLGDDVAAVESFFGRRFVAAPTVVAFATRTSFVRGLEALLGYAPATAEILGAENGGVLITDLGAVLLNWESLREQRPLATPRHELSHVLVHQLAGTGQIPAWLDEGLATLVQRTADESALDVARYRALSLIRTGRADLDSLASAEAWPRRNAELGGLAYAVAAEATSLGLDPVSRAGIAPLLERVGSGTPFAAAYADATGKTLEDFVDTFPALLSAKLGERGIVVGSRLQGADLPWLLYGFAPGSSPRVTVEGEGYRVSFVVTVDTYGIYEGTFGSTAPAGAYELTAILGADVAGGTLSTATR